MIHQESTFAFEAPTIFGNVFYHRVWQRFADFPEVGVVSKSISGLAAVEVKLDGKSGSHSTGHRWRGPTVQVFRWSWGRSSRCSCFQRRPPNHQTFCTTTRLFCLWGGREDGRPFTCMDAVFSSTTGPQRALWVANAHPHRPGAGEVQGSGSDDWKSLIVLSTPTPNDRNDFGGGQVEL